MRDGALVMEEKESVVVEAGRRGVEVNDAAKRPTVEKSLLYGLTL